MQLVLLALLVGGGGRLLGFSPASVRPEERLGELVHMLVDNRTHEQLTRAMARLRDDPELQVSVYDNAGQLIATSVDPPLSMPARGRAAWLAQHRPWLPPSASLLVPPGPPPPDGPEPAVSALPSPPAPDGPVAPWARPERDRDRERRGPRHGLRVMALPLADGPGVLVALLLPPARSPWTPVVMFGCGLLVVGLGAALSARWIVRPLGQLTRAARALGTGDLAARADLDRNDEVGELGRAFDEMAGRIQGLVGAEKELLANVSHELRTPLARIRVALDLAAEGDATLARQALGEIAIDLGELETLVDDILTTARLEAAGGPAQSGTFLPLHLTRVGAGTLAEQSAMRFRQRHPGRTLEVDLAPDLPAIEADPMLLRRVLDNLLDNAHKYTPEPDRPVTLEARAEASGVAFLVRDRGAGIAAADLPHLFTPFFRGDRSRNRGTGGVGLGLALARRIVEAHGGTIELTSSTDEGTVATVRVPAASQPPP